MVSSTFEGAQAGDRCLCGFKHMCLPTHIYSLAHRRPPATGTDNLPALLSPPNTRSRASTGVQLTDPMPESHGSAAHRSSHLGTWWDSPGTSATSSAAHGTCCRAEAFPDYSSSCLS